VKFEQARLAFSRLSLSEKVSQLRKKFATKRIELGTIAVAFAVDKIFNAFEEL
jgi:thiamine biosynthesis lipoprotein ApbE